MLCEATRSRSDKTSVRLLFFVFFLTAGRRRALSLRLRVEGKMALNATTSLQNKLVSLPTDNSTSLSTHGSHSDTQSSPRRLIWNDK